MNPLIPLTHRDVVFVDCESSGLDPSVHEVIEWAAVRMTADLQTEKGRLEKKVTMRHPERADARALAVVGYTPQEWRHAVPMRVVCVDFANLIDDDCLVVGHNPYFDWNFLRAAYAMEGLLMPQVKTILDTISIAWPLVMTGHFERLQLDGFCTKYGISNDGKHRAMADVQRTARLYAKLLGKREPRFAVTPLFAPAPPVQSVDPFSAAVQSEPEWAR
jgi:DNA polymerase III subunit epsilon